jgi:hypothetical protein
MPSFYPCLKSCALHRKSGGGTCGAADDTVHIVGKDNVRIRSSEKILKFVGEEPTSVTPDEIEKLVASSSAIVALFKRLSDGCMIARLDFAIAAVRFPSAL